MPNHVHAVFVLNPAWSLEKIILSWKGFTARKINPLLGRTGSFWQRDYFDRLVRDAKHLANCVRYIRRNPDKGRLRKGESLVYESEFARNIERHGALERRRSLVQSNSCSSSSSRRSNNCSVLSMGEGVVMSTPAAFNVSSGNLEPPERKNFRYASTLPGWSESTRCDSVTAAEIPVAYL